MNGPRRVVIVPSPDEYARQFLAQAKTNGYRLEFSIDRRDGPERMRVTFADDTQAARFEQLMQTSSLAAYRPIDPADVFALIGRHVEITSATTSPRITTQQRGFLEHIDAVPLRLRVAEETPLKRLEIDPILWISVQRDAARARFSQTRLCATSDAAGPLGIRCPAIAQDARNAAPARMVRWCVTKLVRARGTCVTSQALQRR